MDEELTSVRRFLAQRHIVLNNEWEENVIRYIKLNIRKVDEGIESYNLPELVLEQWLYSDLRESTRSSLNIPANANSTNGGKPAILQLVSVVDISDSFYSQYRSRIVDLSKDDSEFHDPSENPREQVKTRHGTKNIVSFCVQAPKKVMHMYEFSDGNIIIKAVAADKIYGLDSDTYLGAKILLIPKYVSRNRVIKLTSKNCQFLGGCNSRCIEENSNPLKVLCQKLGKNYEDAVLQASKSKNQLNQTMKAVAILQPQSTVVQAMIAPQPLQKSQHTVVQTPMIAPQPLQKSQHTVVQTVQRQQVIIQQPPKSDMPMTTLIQPPPLQKETLQPTPKKPEPMSPPFFSFPSPPKYQPPKPPTVAVNNDIHAYDISDTTLNDYGSAGKSTLKPTSIQKP
uniref:RecQ mediated genome instability protein 1-like N-terminal helical domain-containing protein n=1 Tax=Panagrolaimus sp. PS1159 TaxID=55785 RepID=A0AC35G6Y2_9BILA